MILKNGWVSNSSTSSFIIQTTVDGVQSLFSKVGYEMPPEEIQWLKKIGFVPVPLGNPLWLEFGVPYKEERNFKTKNETYLGYTMSCNQDFMLQLLVAKNIPFSAAVHYGHYTYVYRRDADFIYIFFNYGAMLWTTPEHIDNPQWVDCMLEKEPCRKVPKQEFLRRYDEQECLDYLLHDRKEDGNEI